MQVIDAWVVVTGGQGAGIHVATTARHGESGGQPEEGGCGRRESARHSSGLDDLRQPFPVQPYAAQPGIRPIPPAHTVVHQPGELGHIGCGDKAAGQAMDQPVLDIEKASRLVPHFRHGFAKPEDLGQWVLTRQVGRAIRQPQPGG